MKSQRVNNKNLDRLYSGFQELVNRSKDVPGMGVLTGPTGAGKTTGIAWIVNQVNGYHVRARATWTVTALLDACVAQLFGPDVMFKTNSAKVDQIVEVMAGDRRPLFVDEGDFLFKDTKMLETLRDIFDLSFQPVVVIGMEGFDHRLAQRKQYARRVLQWIKFGALDLADIRLYVDTITEVKLTDDMVAKLQKESGGLIGNIAVAIELIESFARGRELTEVSAAAWGDRQMVFTKAPKVAV